MNESDSLEDILYDIAAIAEDPVADERGEGVSAAFHDIQTLAERGLSKMEEIRTRLARVRAAIETHRLPVPATVPAGALL